MSLYLLSGLSREVEFPLAHPASAEAQKAPRVSMRVDQHHLRFTPATLRSGCTLTIQALKHPVSAPGARVRDPHLGGGVMSAVIVIGAGIAGLAAARTLAEAGNRVILIEARDRVGGRIHTLPAVDGGLPVELGAEFIHGLPPELIDLVDQAGLTRFELEGDYRCYRQGRGIGPCDHQREVDQVFDQLSHLRPPNNSPDLSFHEFAVLRGFSPDATAWASNYVEGFNAADADRISVLSLAKQQAAEDAISGDRAFRVVEGYAQLPAFLVRRFLEAGGELVLSAPVRSVDWQPGRVEVATLARSRLPGKQSDPHLASGRLAGKERLVHPRTEDSRGGRPANHGTGCAHSL